MTSQEFSPRESLERILARWWVIVLITVLGGIVGWTFHFLQPPIYEASAVITINMDFTKRELTQYEEDYAFNAAGAIIASTPVEDQIVSEARAQGIPIDIKSAPASNVFGRETVGLGTPCQGLRSKGCGWPREYLGGKSCRGFGCRLEDMRYGQNKFKIKLAALRVASPPRRDRLGSIQRFKPHYKV